MVPTYVQHKYKNYGYRVDAPVATKEQTYTYDFQVEEPKVEVVKEEAKPYLYARMDKMAIPYKDCVEDTDSSYSYGSKY